MFLNVNHSTRHSQLCEILSMSVSVPIGPPWLSACHTTVTFISFIFKSLHEVLIRYVCSFSYFPPSPSFICLFTFFVVLFMTQQVGIDQGDIPDLTQVSVHFISTFCFSLFFLTMLLLCRPSHHRSPFFLFSLCSTCLRPISCCLMCCSCTHAHCYVLSCVWF